MDILTWNLFHGRSLPGHDRDLAARFTALMAGWAWDVALLQEVPPWWAARLAAASGAEQRGVLTSRNSLLALRQALGARRPELMKSNGGGSNVVLARQRAIVEHHRLALRRWPERRIAQLVRLSDGTCVANFHASARVPLAEEELAQLWERALAWAGSDPLVLGGDLNLRKPQAPDVGAIQIARRDVDHLFAVRLESTGEPELLDRHVTLAAGGVVELSDHPPLRVSVGIPAGSLAS